MANNHTRVSKRGNALTATSTTTDAPLLPMQQMRQLQELSPARLEWMFNETEIEAKHRRSENRRINTMIFIERVLGLFFALVVTVLGLGSAVYCAQIDREITAGIIGGATLVGLAVAFISGHKSEK